MDQRAVADAGFLELIRLGIKPASDRVIINSLQVVSIVNPISVAVVNCDLAIFKNRNQSN